MDMDLGSYLRARRKAAGLTQQELADAIGMTKSFVSQLERGVRKGNRADSADTLVAIAKALNADPGTILSRAGHEPPAAQYSRQNAHDTLERAILSDHTLDSEERAFLLRAVEMVRRPRGKR